MKALIALLPQALRRSLLGRLPALLALLAAGLLAIARLSAGGAEQAVVGLVLPAAPSPEAELAAALLTSLDAPLPFRLSTETEAREAVAAGRWDCAFLLGEDLRARRPVTLLRSGSTLLAGPASEAVSAALLHALSPSIAAGYLSDSGMLGALTEDQAAALLEGRLQNDRPMEVELLGSPGSLTLDAASAAPVVRWCLSVLVLLDLTLCAVRLKRQRQRGWYRRALPLAGAAPLDLALLLGSALSLLPAAILLPAACALLPGFGAAPSELGLLLLWWLAALPLPLMIERLVRREALIRVALPFLLAACLLLCPALFDAGRLFPALGPLSRLLPPTWYLLAASGGSRLPLLLGGAACWALGGLALLIPSRGPRSLS